MYPSPAPKEVSETMCSLQFSSVHSLSHVQLFVTPWTVAHQASLSINNSWNLFKLLSIESVMPSNHLILYCSLLLLSSIFPSIRVFSNESALALSGQSFGDSAAASVLPMNIQVWFPLGLAGLISLQSKRFSRVFSNTTVQKCQFLILSFLFSPTCDSADKESAFNTGDLGLIPELGRSPGKGKS